MRILKVRRVVKMADIPDLQSNIILYVTPEKFYLEYVGSTEKVTSIDRVTEEIKCSDKSEIPVEAKQKLIDGVIGSIKLLSGNHLVVVTRKKKVGSINGQTIWMILGTEIISYPKTYHHLNEKQLHQNKTYLNMLKLVLHSSYFYFSYTYDITHSLQRLQHTPPEFIKLPMHKRANPMFLWNKHLLREFSTKKELSKYCLCVLYGFVSINHFTFNGNSFSYILISRRSTYRVGTRLFTRGIDSLGHVANFVETEQIVEYCGFKGSFVQTRGSIPLYWQQLPSLKYKPKPKLIMRDHTDAFHKHMDFQILHYGRQILVNLIDHHGAESELEKAYKQHVINLSNPNVRYEGFDFHAECRRMRYDRINILIDRLSHEQDEFGYFLVNGEGTVFSEQGGGFRTNCIDCLDRTNVVQSLLAKRNFGIILRKLNILGADQNIRDVPGLDLLFKNVWADNADAISIQYSGTRALKTDFTRFGKRTRAGAFKDLINSMNRYYKNNFNDGFRQDALDLFVGNYLCQASEGITVPSPLEKRKGWKYFTFPLVLLIAISMFCANVVTPTEYTTETLCYILFWGSMVVGTLVTIFTYGVEFVDYPKLTEK